MFLQQNEKQELSGETKASDTEVILKGTKNFREELQLWATKDTYNFQEILDSAANI